MTEWYYTQDNQQRGPVSTAELQKLADAGQLRPTDLVWREGMANWDMANTKSELFPRSSSVPPAPIPAAPYDYDEPPPPPRRPRRRPYDEDYDRYDHPSRRHPDFRKRGMSTGAMVALICGVAATVLLVVIIIVVVILTRDDADGELRMGRTLFARLSVNDRDDNGRFYRVYTVRLNAGRRYQFDLTDMNGTGLMMYVKDGNMILAQDSGNPFGGFNNNNRNPRITFMPNRSGTYRVWVTTTGMGMTGSFSLRVQQRF